MTFLFLTFFTFTAAVAQSSGDSSEVQIAYAPLDLSQVPSGLLYDKSLQLVGTKYLDGVYMSDSNYAEINVFGLAYATILSMNVTNESPLPPANESYMGYVDEELGSPEEVNMALLYFNYHRLDSLSIDNGLITWDGTRFRDVPNRTSSPYNAHQLMVSSAIVSKWTGLEVPFRFPQDLLHTNEPNVIHAIYFDFDDGNGFVPLSANELVNIGYSEYGRKDIRVKVERTDGTEHMSHFFLDVEEALFNKYGLTPSFPDIIIPPRGNSFNGIDPHSGGELSVFLSCDGVFNKPLLVLDGIDFNDTRDWGFLRNEILTIRDLDDNSITLANILDEEGYDIVFVNYTDGTDDLRRNSAFLKEAILTLNDMKRNNSPHYVEKNIILGPSMGGIISKYTLLKMEADGVDHETKKLITLDGALQGGHTPLGLQHAIFHLNDVEVSFIGLANSTLGSLVPKIRNGKTTLSRPAVKQLLIHHALSPDGQSPLPEHLDFFNEINSMSGPENFEFVTMSCGSVTGISQTLVPGGTIVGYVGNLREMIFYNTEWYWAASLSLATEGYVRITINAMPNGSGRVYKGDYYAVAIPGTIIYGSKDVSVTNVRAMDSAPGGFNNFRKSLGINFPIFAVGPAMSCFIPTVGSLDIPINSTNPFTAPGTAGPMVDRFWGSVDASLVPDPVEFESAPAQANQAHSPPVNRTNLRFLYRELLSTDELFNPVTEFVSGIYHFGKSLTGFTTGATGLWTTRNIIDYNLSVVGNAQALWVCRNGKIGNVFNSANRQNDAPTFDVIIQKGDFCGEKGKPITVRFEDGGNMIIGQWDNVVQRTGHVYVMEDATVEVYDGSKIEINKGSSFYIKPGGSVQIHEGGMLQAQFGGKITVDGELHVYKNGILRISQDSYLDLVQGGHLILDEGAKVQLWDGQAPKGRAVVKLAGRWEVGKEIDFSGNGYFEVHSTHELALQQGAWTMNGMGKDFLLFSLLKGAILDFKNGDISFSNMQIVYLENASIHARRPGNSLQMVNCDFVEKTANTSVALYLENSTRVRVLSSDFSNFKTGVELATIFTSNNGVEAIISDCEFKENTTGVEARSVSPLWVVSSTFLAGTSGGEAISASLVASLRLNNNDISGYINAQNKGAINLRYVNECIIRGGNIYGNYNGIVCPSPFWANVRMYNQASIHDNRNYGILLEQGGAVYGTGYVGVVTMDCARLENNGVAGIKGDDILLDIDAYIHSYGNLNYLRSNSYQCSPQGKLFDICYSARYPFQGILARGNYWGTHNSNITTQINNLHTVKAGQNGACIMLLPFNVAFNPLISNTTCPTPPNPGEPGSDLTGTENKCNEIKVNNMFVEGEWAHASYQEAYSLYQNFVENDLSTQLAREAFAYLSEVSKRERDQANDNCQYFVDVAKSMIEMPERQDEATFGLPANPFISQNTYQGFQVYPNPASDRINLVNMEGENLVQLIDAMGRILFEQKIQQPSVTISTETMETGMYFLMVKPISTVSTPVIWKKVSINKQ